jgi:hypothetical protein
MSYIKIVEFSWYNDRYFPESLTGFVHIGMVYFTFIILVGYGYCYKSYLFAYVDFPLANLWNSINFSFYFLRLFRQTNKSPAILFYILILFAFYV